MGSLISSHTTLAEWLLEWLEVYKIPAVKEKSAGVYRFIVAVIVKAPCAQLPIRDVTEKDLQMLLNQAAKQHYAKSTLEKIRYTLRQCYRPLVRQGDIERSPAKELVLPLAVTKEVLPLKHKEQDAVEAACARDALGHLLIFLLWTGLRKGEMMALKWSDYDAQDGSITIRNSKTEAGIRKVYLVSIAKDIVERMPRINEYIFNHTRNAPVTPTVMRRLVERVRDKSGVEHLACHVCRHTFVTRLCEKGAPAKAIAQIIGHANSDYVLDIYAKLEADELRKVIYILDEKGGRSKLMGANVTLPVDLYLRLEEEAKKQHVSVDALATFLLTSVTATS